MTIPIDEWLDYLFDKVDRDVYVLGSQGENIITLFPKICEMETNRIDLVDNILTLLNKRYKKGINFEVIFAYDCSGLFMKFAMDRDLFKHDMTANDIYNSVPNKISVSSVDVGDFVFMGTDSNKEHIGYVIDKEYVIEARGTAYGVVKTKLSERNWKYAARPYWWSGISYDKPVLTRELFYVQNNLMRGDDVLAVQIELNKRHCSVGSADGVFGKKTKTGVEKFQSENNLTVDGVVGKKTAEALGFKFKG